MLSEAEKEGFELFHLIRYISNT